MPVLKDSTNVVLLGPREVRLSCPVRSVAGKTKYNVAGQNRIGSLPSLLGVSHVSDQFLLREVPSQVFDYAH